jgi:hypothetical protein
LELDIETTSVTESYQEEKGDIYEHGDNRANIELEESSSPIKRPHASVANWLNQNHHHHILEHPHSLQAFLVPFHPTAMSSDTLSLNQYSNHHTTAAVTAAAAARFLSMSNQ